MAKQQTNPVEVHEQNFTEGVNMDVDENAMPNTAGYFLKNAINGINNGQGTNQEGFSLESLTKLPANFTDFDNSVLPHFRNYTLDLTALTYPVKAWSFVADWSEIKDVVQLNTAFDTNVYMLSLGWSQGSGQNFFINNTVQWQRFNFLKPDNTFVSFDPVKVSDGATWGNNTCIGTKYDVKLNQYFVFNFNDSDRHSIWLYDANLNQYQLVLETPLLNFDLEHRITAINIILLPTKDSNGAEVIERLLYWTDNTNQPRKINIDRCLDYEYLGTPMDYVTEDQFMRVIKFVPFPYPSFDGTQPPDSSIVQNYIQRSLFQFMLRHICDDKEQTVYSSISSLFVPKIQVDMTGVSNFVLLQNLDAGSEIVTNIEIAYRTSNINEWLTYIVIPRSDILTNPIYNYNATTNQFQYKFFNNRQAIPIDTTVSSKNYDEVPQLAGAQEFISTNMLAYGNGVNGYDNFETSEINKLSITSAFSLFTTLQLNARGTFSATLSGASTNNFTLAIVMLRGGVETIIEQGQIPIDLMTFTYDIQGVIDNPQEGDQYFVQLIGRTNNNITSLLLLANTTEFSGAYSNVIPANNGNFNVSSTTNQDLLAASINDRITYNHIISDPQNTFTLDNPSTPNITNFDTNPNVALNGTHLKNGGQYQFGLVGKDEAGREGFVQTMDSLVVTIPHIQDSTQGIKQSALTLNFGGIVVPDWVDTLHVVRTQNLLLNNGAFGPAFIQWQIYNIKYLDVNGNVLGADIETATSVQFQLFGLVAFNTQYQLNTTTTYTWTKGDRVQFLSSYQGGNDQNYYVENVDVELKSVDSITFTAPVSGPLLTVPLNDYSIVEIYTPNSTQGTSTYYEIHNAVKCTGNTGNNQPVVSSVAIPTFDTYLIERSIPGSDETQGAYESPSAYDYELVPSNGEDIGRVNVVNTFAQRVRDYSLIQYSNAFNPDSQINGLSTFDDGDSMLYFQEFGAIVKMLCSNYNMIIVQESKAFRILVAKNILTDNSGNNTLTATDEILSSPIEIDGDFGCQTPETFVATKNGLLYWVDLKRGRFVVCDWKTASDAGSIGFDAYAMSKLKYLFNNNNANPDNSIYLQSGYDPLNDTVQTSFFLPSQGFINSASGTNITLNETLGIYNTRKKFAGFFSYTPEYFGTVEGHRLGTMMITFKNGVPYYHNNSSEYLFNNFYGVDCRQYIGFVAHDVLWRNNLNVISLQIGGKTKNFLNMGIDTRDSNTPSSLVQYSALSILTSVGQISSIPQAAGQFKEGILWMPFFKNSANSGSIISGENLKGIYARILLIDNAEAQNVYNRLNKIFVVFNYSEKTF